MVPPNSAEQRLIERARGGDRVAQHELWRDHRRWVAAILLAHRPRSAEIDDLMQDVAVKLISKIHTLRESNAFRPWLRQVAINVCRGAARSAKPELHFDAEDRSRGGGIEPGRVTEPAADGSRQEALEQSDAANRLLEHALSLPITYREPLLLRCVRSMSYQQICDILDLPMTTIETRLARARRMLREEAGERADSNAGLSNARRT